MRIVLREGEVLEREIEQVLDLRVILGAGRSAA